MKNHARFAFLFASFALLPFSMNAQEQAASGESDNAAPVATATPTPKSSRSVEDSVVKIFATKRYPDLIKPWTRQSPSDVTASGVVIEGNRILTNAHVVLYASQIQVQANQSGDKILANVEYVAPGIDLAVLKLTDEDFFTKHKPLPRSNVLPRIKDSVMAYGFPTGGTTLSITKGIVSRIEYVNYNGSTTGLRIQIDAAINPGNSGGPAVIDDKMVGLAFSHGEGENISYVIPCEEIELFLKDIADGRYDGKAFIPDTLQTLENDALIAFLKVDKSTNGLVVNSPTPWVKDNPLQKWDIITQIGGQPIDRQGMVFVNGELRINWRYHIQHYEKDGKVPLGIIRAGKPMTIDYPVQRKVPWLINYLDGAYPDYFIYGPIVFSTVTRELVVPFQRSGDSIISMLWTGGTPLFTRLSDTQDFPGEELVVITSPFLPHNITKGYSSSAMQVVKSVNGADVKNFQHLVELLRDNTDTFVRFEFAGSKHEIIIFKRAEIEAALDDILNDNGIRSQGSPALMKVWNQKK